MYVDVKSCQRCGKDHEHTAFDKLLNPRDDYSYYGYCSVTSQPILLKIQDNGTTRAEAEQKDR